MDGELILGRGEYDISIATGKPPGRVAVTARHAEHLAGVWGPAATGPVILETPRILGDGFAFRATVMGAPCIISYRYTG